MYNEEVEKFLIGVDEAGRGPLAGPVAVGVVRARKNYDIAKHFPGVADSKLLTPEKRERIYKLLQKKAAAGELQFCVRFSGHVYIDRLGITKAVRRAVWSGVKALAPDALHTRVMLDGLLKAPPEYEQKTIIHGDALVPIISLASIAAKVERDRLMLRLAKKKPPWGVGSHKGYGTTQHLRALAQFGLCEAHRRSYLPRRQGGLQNKIN